MVQIMSGLTIDEAFERLFPSMQWSDEEIAEYAYVSSYSNESQDKQDNMVNIDIELSVEEYTRRENYIELREFIKFAKNRLCQNR